MPNWVTNGVRISHPREEKMEWLTKKVIHTEGDEELFDFNKIVEMPKALIGSKSPSTVVKTQAEADRINKENKGKPYNVGKTISEKESKEYKGTYGADNWYDWSINNWGVKWNASDFQLLGKGKEGKDYWVDIQFNTAWETPDRIWNSLELRGFHVSGVWQDEQPDVSGDIDYGTFNDSPFYISSTVERY